MRRYSARVGDLGGLERLAALQSEIEAKKLSEPGALERTFGVGAGIDNSVMNFRKGQKMLKAQAAEKQAERERRGQEFIVKEGLEELPQGAEIPAGAKVHEYAGKRWVKRPEGIKTAQPKTYAKQMKVVGDEWVIFDPLTGDREPTNIKITPEAQREPNKQLKILKDDMGRQYGVVFNPKTGKWETIDLNTSDDPLGIRP